MDYCTYKLPLYIVFRAKVRARLKPKLKDFQPHILFLSSGFDAHYDDNYHFLTEDDYYWLTDELISACNHYGTPTTRESDCVSNADGFYYDGECRVVSVLEGGYSLSSATPPLSGGAAAPLTTQVPDVGEVLQVTAPNSRAVAAGRATRSKSGHVQEVTLDGSDSGHVPDSDSVLAPTGVSYRSALLSQPLAKESSTAITQTNTKVGKGSKRGAVGSKATVSNRYQIQYGDGGLVKGVLAHVAALVSSGCD